MACMERPVHLPDTQRPAGEGPRSQAECCKCFRMQRPQANRSACSALVDPKVAAKQNTLRAETEQGRMGPKVVARLP